MEKSEDAAKVRQVKSLLELIQQLQVEPATGGARVVAENPYIEHWSRYQAAHAATPETASRVPARGGAGVSPWLFVVATLLNTTIAAVLGVLITLSVVRQEPVREWDQSKSSAQVTDLKADPPDRMMISSTLPAAAPGGPIEVQPIGARERPLRLEALKPAHLPLRIHPEDALAETFIMVLSGVPAKADVLGAERIGSDSWLLRPQTIANLQITMPEWSTLPMEIGVELRRTNGAIAGRTTAWISVPPPPMPQSASEGKVDQAALKDLLQRGDQLLARGDIVAARAVYERAAEMASAPAAMALGSTYDPSRLWSLGVFGMVGNKEKARQWYARADQLGHAGAKERLRMLGD